jgi:hypothetical protein
MKVSPLVNGAPREVGLKRNEARIVQAEPGVYSVLLDGRRGHAGYEAIKWIRIGRSVRWQGTT